MSSKTELLIKIKALAEHGVDGEKISAQEFLSRLMDKYGITENDLDERKTACEWFRYRDDLQHRLLHQIIYMVLGETETYKRRGGNFKLVGVYCTVYQRIEIETNYEFFKRALADELRTFFSAFCSKNKLFPQEAISKDDSEFDKKEAFKIALMMQGMERYTLAKMIEKNALQK